MAPSAVAAGPARPSSASSPLVLLLTLFCFFGFSLALDDFWLLPGAALSSAALLAEMPLPVAALLAPATAARVRPAARRHRPSTNRPSSLLMRPIESPAPLAAFDGPVPALGPKQAYPVMAPGLPHHLDVSPISRYRGVSAFYRPASAAMQTAGSLADHGPRPPRPDPFGSPGISTGL